MDDQTFQRRSCAREQPGVCLVDSFASSRPVVARGGPHRQLANCEPRPRVWQNRGGERVTRDSTTALRESDGDYCRLGDGRRGYPRRRDRGHRSGCHRHRFARGGAGPQCQPAIRFVPRRGAVGTSKIIARTICSIGGEPCRGCDHQRRGIRNKNSSSESPGQPVVN